jgi:hypothetical protein
MPQPGPCRRRVRRRAAQAEGEGARRRGGAKLTWPAARCSPRVHPRTAGGQRTSGQRGSAGEGLSPPAGTITQQRRRSLRAWETHRSPALPVRPPSRPDKGVRPLQHTLTIGLRALPVADSELCMAASAAPETPAGAGGPNPASNPPRRRRMANTHLRQYTCPWRALPAEAVKYEIALAIGA